MKQAIYKNELVKVLDYIKDDIYLIELKNKKKIKVGSNELLFIGRKSLYD